MQDFTAHSLPNVTAVNTSYGATGGGAQPGSPWDLEVMMITT